MTGRGSAWVGRLHRLLRIALPEEFRARHGPDMERVFRERLVAERACRGARGVAESWMREALDLFLTGVRLRIEGHRGRGGEMRTILDDLRSAVRSLRRSPGFAAFAVGTLTLGIGSTITFAAFLDRIVLRPVDFPGGERVVLAWRTRDAGGLMISPDVATRERVRRADVFEGVAAVGGREVAWSTDEGPRTLDAMLMDDAFPTLAGLAPLRGSFFGPDELAGEGAPVVVLSEGMWRREFGGADDAVGRTLRIDGTLRTVVGVAPDALRPPMPGNPASDLWLPLPADGSEAGLSVIGRLREGITLEQANERMTALDAAAAEAERSPWGTRLVPAAQMVTGRLQSPLKVAGAAVVLLLLIACMNLANLLLARGDARVRDTALRAALGAGRGRLARELLMENGVLAGLACALGLALAQGVLAGVRALSPADLRILETLSLDPWVTAGAVGCGLATVLLFGAFPLVHRVRTRPGTVLSERGGTGSGDSVRLRRALLVGEVALSFVMLTGAIQIVATLAQARSRDPGVAADELLAVTLRLPEWRLPDATARENALREIRARLLALPGVEAVGVASGVPTRTGIYFGTPEADGGAPPAEAGDGGNVVFFGAAVSPGWFEAVGHEIVQGRGFIEEDLVADVAPYVLGESAAERYFPEGNAVGGRFRLGDGPWHTVVGVARDRWSTGSMNDPAYPQLYPLLEAGEGHALLVRTRDPAALADAIRPAVRDVDLEIPVMDVSPVAALYARALSRERLIALLLAFFAATAAVLAAVGLYGVAAQLAVRRTREYGIRISLGARRQEIFGLALRGGAVAVAAGLTAGAAAAWAALRFLQAGIAGLAASDPRAFAAAAALLAGATLLAMGVPALRAARTDPVEALRSE